VGVGSAILAVALTAALVWHDAWREEQLRDRQADRVLSALDEARLDAFSGFLLGSALVEDGGRLPADSFERLSAAVLAQDRATTVSFVEIVDDADRAAWEERVARPVEEFRGTERRPAARRDRYYVVSAVAPDEPLFTQAVGVDLATSRVLGPVVRAAVGTGEPTMTDRAVWGNTGDVGFGIAVPLQDSAGRVVALLVPTYRAETLDPAVEAVLAREGTGVRVEDSGDLLLEVGHAGAVAETRELRRFGRVWSVSTTFDEHVSPAWSAVLAGGLLAPAAGWLSWQRSRREREREALLAREQVARADADRSTSLLVQVNDVAGRLAGAETVAQVASLAAEQGCDAVGATRSVAMMRVRDRLRIVEARGYPDDVIARYRTVPVDLPTAVPHVLRDATPLWIESAAEYEALFPEYGEEYRRLGHEAGVFLPLVGPTGAEGVLVYHFSQRRSFTAPEREALEIPAAQAAATVTRLSALERERAARRLSEALRRHAERLTTAVRPSDVAAVVLDLLVDNGAEVASFHRVADGDVVLGARGPNPDRPPDPPHQAAAGQPVTGRAVPLTGATGQVVGVLVVAARRPWPDT
jgi:hypothetical protein